MGFAIVDIQGFFIEKKKFTPKELTLLKNGQIAHFVFKEPYAFNKLPDVYKKQVVWLSNNHHCIKWNSGFIQPWRMDDILQNLTDDVRVVYVKGHEKTEIISNFIPSKRVVELPESPALVPDLPMCVFHQYNYCYCTLRNVYFIQDNFGDFIKKNFSEISEQNENDYNEVYKYDIEPMEICS